LNGLAQAEASVRRGGILIEANDSEGEAIQLQIVLWLIDRHYLFSCTETRTCNRRPTTSIKSQPS
jgi:hypothetical protein